MCALIWAGHSKQGSTRALEGRVSLDCIMVYITTLILASFLDWWMAHLYMQRLRHLFHHGCERADDLCM